MQEQSLAYNITSSVGCTIWVLVGESPLQEEFAIISMPAKTPESTTSVDNRVLTLYVCMSGLYHFLHPGIAFALGKCSIPIPNPMALQLKHCARWESDCLGYFSKEEDSF